MPIGIALWWLVAWLVCSNDAEVKQTSHDLRIFFLPSFRNFERLPKWLLASLIDRMYSTLARCRSCLRCSNLTVVGTVGSKYSNSSSPISATISLILAIDVPRLSSSDEQPSTATRRPSVRTTAVTVVESLVVLSTPIHCISTNHDHLLRHSYQSVNGTIT